MRYLLEELTRENSDRCGKEVEVFRLDTGRFADKRFGNNMAVTLQQNVLLKAKNQKEIRINIGLCWEEGMY